MDYRQIMMAEQAAARGSYSYDPRQVLLNTNNFSNVVTFNSTQPTNLPEVRPEDYGEVVGTRLDAQVVQDAPKTRSSKRYIIIDASQRDWVKQPNPYTNLQYSFGSQAVAVSNPPVYENNSFIPTFAVEQTQNPQPIPGIPNIGGWSLNVNGNIVSYRAYNSSLPRGNFIAYDTGYAIQPSGSGFGSVFTPCNVQSIRLVRAVLPQRQFLNLAIDPSSGSPDYATSQYIQSNLANKPYSTFTTYPYLLLYLNEYFGQYVGGNEPMRRSFSVMTQRGRQQTFFDTAIGVQQYDYEPWNEDALKLQSPITSLQKLAITITDPVGTGFVQTDNLTVSLIQASANSMYLECFTNSFQYFSGNELRVGDRISFYPQTISNILNSPILALLNPQKRSFVNSLLSNTFPVLQLLDYVLDSNGIYVPRDASSARTTPYISSYNGFIIPNFITIGTNGNATPTFPNSIDPGSFAVLEPNVLVGSNLAVLNTSLQPVFTLEIETTQPDTSQIGGMIVTPS